jgi:hypothetical protein
MFTATGLVCVVLWAIMAWAVQNELERSYDSVTCAREEDIELEWRDYCTSVIGKRCDVSWTTVPCVVKTVYATGALGLVLVGHLFWWYSTSCFGDIDPNNDSVDNLEWYGSDEKSIVMFAGLAGLITTCVSCIGLLVFRAWKLCATRETVRRCRAELATQEEDWKENRLSMCSLPAASSEDMRAMQVVHSDVQAHDELGKKAAVRHGGLAAAEHSLREQALGEDTPPSPVIPEAIQKMLPTDTAIEVGRLRQDQPASGNGEGSLPNVIATPKSSSFDSAQPEVEG